MVVKRVMRFDRTAEKPGYLMVASPSAALVLEHRLNSSRYLDETPELGGNRSDEKNLWRARRHSELIERLTSASSMMAPTGLEPVFTVRHALSYWSKEVRRC